MAFIKGKQLEADTLTTREIGSDAVTSDEALTGGVTSDASADTTAGEGTSTKIAREDHVHALDATTGTMSTVSAGDTTSDGTAAGLSRRDHQHAVDITNGAQSTINAGDAAVEGSGTGLARRDHQHAVDTTNGAISEVNAGDGAAEGSGAGISRRDHQHSVASAAAGTTAIGDAAAEGSSTSLARADHTHAVGTPGVPETNNASAGAAGSSTTPARADHRHSISVGATTAAVGTTASGGAATSVSRSDHVHVMGASASEDVLDSKRFAFGVQILGVQVANSATYTENNAVTKAMVDVSASKSVEGSASHSAIVTTGDNKVLLRDSITNDPIETTSNEQVYGRLTTSWAPINLQPATWNGTTTVILDGTGTAVVGDFISPDSDPTLPMFEVSVVSGSTITILNPGGIQIPSGSYATIIVLTKLSYYYEDSSDAEQVYTFTSATDIDIVFSEALGLNEAPFGALTSGIAFAENLAATHTHTIVDLTDITASAAEINALDGAGLSTTELQILDGATVTTAELNKLDGFTGTYTDLNILDGATISTAELNSLKDGGDIGSSLHTHGQYAEESVLTTKGDLFVRTGTALVRLPVGTDGTVLTAASGDTNGVGWSSPIAVDVEYQESIATQNITTDVALTDTLDHTPKSNAAVALYLNGVFQVQGTGKDYTLSGPTITWLAGTGTAVDMSTTDTLMAIYVG